MRANMDPVVVVHGGAWKIPDHLDEPSTAGVKKAAADALAALEGGCSAEEAVEIAVKVMESAEFDCFDAGTGSVLNEEGAVEMDAAIMRGSDLECGAVAGVSCVEHPVSLARGVMNATSHTMIVGERPTRKLAQQLGFPIVGSDALIRDAARAEYEHYKRYGHAVTELFNKSAESSGSSSGGGIGHDTVGCVCIDKQGSVAAATSTGGITAKKAGRVGDSPVIGCGTYADDAVGAVSATGHGESITRVALASQILLVRLASETDATGPAAAVASALHDMQRRVGGCGGAICVGRDGSVGLGYTTEKMAWAVARSGRAVLGGVHAPAGRDARLAAGWTADVAPLPAQQSSKL